MVLTSGQKPNALIQPLVKTAAASGIIQGLLWTILSLVAITYHYNGMETPTNAGIGFYIYSLYLDKSQGTNIYIISSPPNFLYILYIYLVLSLVWCIASCALLWAVLKGKTEKLYEGSIGAWTVDASVLSLLDLILVCLIAYDYDLLKGGILEPLQNMFLVAMGVIMTLFARGFVLWIINVIFIVILSKHWLQLKNQGPDRSRAAINAYAAESSLPPWPRQSNLYNDLPEFDNKGFRDDNNPASPYAPKSQDQFMEDRYPNSKGGRERTNDNARELPQVNLRRPPTTTTTNNNNNNNDNYWINRNQNRGGGARPSPRPYAEQDSTPNPSYLQPTPFRTARLGRQGDGNGRSPYIPDPDYSPPGSPKVPGVLRSKSNYQY